jgi:microprocessor complex subunit DGCR8
VVVINGIEFGKGVGSSKRLAKNNAAKKTLEILIPEIKGKLGSNEGEDEADMPDLTVCISRLDIALSVSLFSTSHLSSSSSTTSVSKTRA